MAQQTEEELLTAKLEQLSKTSMHFGTNAHNALRLGRLTPEQKLSYVLSMLVEHQKSTLLLMKVINTFAEELVAFKKRNQEKEN